MATGVGSKIKKFRVAAGMTRRILANAIDITEGGLYKIEREDHVPSFALVAAIAKVLGKSLGDFDD